MSDADDQPPEDPTTLPTEAPPVVAPGAETPDGGPPPPAQPPEKAPPAEPVPGEQNQPYDAGSPNATAPATGPDVVAGPPGTKPRGGFFGGARDVPEGLSGEAFDLSTPVTTPVAGFGAGAPVSPDFAPAGPEVLGGVPGGRVPEPDAPGGFATAEASVAPAASAVGEAAGGGAVEADASAERACPHCGETTPAQATFCEVCGETIDASPAAVAGGSHVEPCVSCGARASAIDTDGYCSSCGYKQPEPRDHIEVDHGSAAAVTDKGKRHRHNEDSFAVALVDRSMAMVVCDGVSTTADSDAASQGAADAALGVLTDALAAGSDLQEATVRAVAAGQEAVAAVPVPDGAAAAPSCTIVTSVVTPLDTTMWSLVIGWLGDTRGYHIDPGGAATQLTVDHSWAKEQVRNGDMEEAAAFADPRASSITRWLGRDALDVVPEMAALEIAAGSRVVLSSDGLWNYVPTDAELTAKLAEFSGHGPLALAAALCDFANAQGGHDNITIVVGQT